MSYSDISQVGDNIYVNVAFSKNPDSTAFEEAAEYSVSKTIPILAKADDYYCSIIRFAIPLNETPLLIMPIVPNQVNPNLTPLKIGISVGGINFTRNVIYVSNTNAPIPVQNQSIQVITSYYYVFEYQSIINNVNTALASAFLASGLAGNTPYFYLQPESELIHLVVDIATFSPTATAIVPSPIQSATIYMNNDLEVYLSAFPVIYVAPNSEPGRDYDFSLVRFGGDKLIPPFNIGAVATQKNFTQEYSVLALWSSLRKILITSNTIPIQSEYTPTGNSGISSTLPVITDFIPQNELPGQSRSIAYYNPSAQYRLVDLKSSCELRTIDLKIYWQDIFQNIYPLLISKYQQASIKLAFIKKTLYNDNGLKK